MAKRDPHDVLGVPRSAPVREIRRAYRDLARQLHPDASGTHETAEAFHQATVAYNELREGASCDEAIPVPVRVAEPCPPVPAGASGRVRRRRGAGARRVEVEVEALASRAPPEAEPMVAERWRRTEAQDLAPDLEIDADLELLLRLLRAGYFPW